MRPSLTIIDVSTQSTITREMTDEEYADLIDSGWTPGEESTPEPEPTPEPEEETPEE